MAIKAREVLTILLERIEAAHPTRAYFAAEELLDWPGEALAALLRQDILAEADRAETITCPGCEWQCNKRVVVRRAGSVSRAFILCDEEAEYGRIHVDLGRLKRFTSQLLTLAHFVAGALDIGPPRPSRGFAAYALGVVKGRNGSRPVIVAVEGGRVVLGVGEQREPLTRALQWGASGLVLDTKLVARLADRKEKRATESRRHAPDRSRQAARTSETRKRHLAIYRAATTRYAEGGVTWTRVAEEIAKMTVAGGLSEGRVRRIVSELRNAERKKTRSKPRSSK